MAHWCEGWRIIACRASSASASSPPAQALFAEALAFAEQGGFGAMMLWSDTRFARGHRFYEKLGFRRWPGERYLAEQVAGVRREQEDDGAGDLVGAAEAPQLLDQRLGRGAADAAVPARDRVHTPCNALHLTVSLL